jgi:hypothetical protein
LAVRKKDEAEGSLRMREAEEEGEGQMSARQSVRAKKTNSATATKGRSTAQSRSPSVSELPDLCGSQNETRRQMSEQKRFGFHSKSRQPPTTSAEEKRKPKRESMATLFPGAPPPFLALNERSNKKRLLALDQSISVIL